MKNFKLKAIGTGILLLTAMSPLSAVEFTKTGTIERILEGEDTKYGGCMIKINTSIGENGLYQCSNSGWVSMDCTGTYSSVASGKRKLAMALTGQAAGMTASIEIDDTQKYGNYCVAKRLVIYK